MTIFPEFLYRLTPRDEQVTPLETVIVQLDPDDIVGTSISSAKYTVPMGRLLLLTNVSVEASPPALDRVTRLNFIIEEPNGSIFSNFAEADYQDIATVELIRRHSEAVNIIIPQGWTVQAHANLGAGGAAAYCLGSICGVLIPRGNFAV